MMLAKVGTCSLRVPEVAFFVFPNLLPFPDLPSLLQVFLQHLQSLASLPTFTALWLTILDLLGQFCARYWSSSPVVNSEH